MFRPHPVDMGPYLDEDTVRYYVGRRRGRRPLSEEEHLALHLAWGHGVQGSGDLAALRSAHRKVTGRTPYCARYEQEETS